MGTRTGGRPSGRAAMIEAAERVARRDGPGAVTVDAVVKEAGISRGGLLYHFPSKLDLIRALLDQDVQHLRWLLIGDVEPTDRDDAQRTAANTPAERLRLYVDECSAAPGQRDYAALAAALAEDPSVAEPWATLQRDLDQLDTEQSGPGDVRTIVARLALDGLWLSNLVDPDRFTPEQMDRILGTIWSDEASEPQRPPAGGGDGT